jgi:hypothetical protein
MRAKRGKKPAEAPHPELATHFGNIEEVAETPTPSNPEPEAESLLAPTSDAVTSPEVVLEQAEQLKERAELPDKSKSELEAIISRAKSEDEARLAIEALYVEEDKAEAEARRAEIEYANTIIEETEEEIRLRESLKKSMALVKKEAPALIKKGKVTQSKIDERMMDGDFIVTEEPPPFDAKYKDKKSAGDVALYKRHVVDFLTSTRQKNWEAVNPKKYYEDVVELLKDSEDAKKTALDADMIQDRFHPTFRKKQLPISNEELRRGGAEVAKKFVYNSEPPLYTRSGKSIEFRKKVEDIQRRFKELTLKRWEFIDGLRLFDAQNSADDTHNVAYDEKRKTDAERLESEKKEMTTWILFLKRRVKLLEDWMKNEEFRTKYNEDILVTLADAIDWLEEIPESSSDAPTRQAPPKYKRKDLPPVPKKKNREDMIRDILTNHPKTKLLTISKALKELGYEGTAVSTLAPIVKRIREDLVE